MESSDDDKQIQSIDKMIKKGRKNIDLPMDSNPIAPVNKTRKRKLKIVQPVVYPPGESDIIVSTGSMLDETPRKNIDLPMDSNPIVPVNKTRKRKLKIVQPVESDIIVSTGSMLDETPRKNEIYADVLNRLSILMNKKGDVMRSRIYSRAQDTILSASENITSSNQLEGKPNIGPTIIAKLTEYDKTGTLQVFEREKDNPEIWLTDVYGIGPKKAQDLVKSGIKTIQDLRSQQDSVLNDKQRIGLKYYEDILKRIPRNEIEKFDKMIETEIQALDSTTTNYEIVGSYRRGAKTSGDIDVIITSSDASVFSKVISSLKSKDIIIEILSQGDTKCLVIAKMPGLPYARRVDFMFTPPEEYPFATLYFTGSKAFNTTMRSYALKLGLSLNEHGFYYKEKGKEKGGKIDKIFKTEESIFESIYLKYKKPIERVDGRAVETTLPIVYDKDIENIEKNGQSCYKSCDTVPKGECVTGCSPSWTDDKLRGSRNWCTCNLRNTDCIIPICPAHEEPIITKPEKKQRKTKKKSPDDKVTADSPARKTKKKSPEIKEKKPPTVKKTTKRVKIVKVAPRLVIEDDNIEEPKINIVTDELPELVPILHLDKTENITISKVEVKPSPNNKTRKNPNKKKKQLKIKETDIKLNPQEDNMESKIKKATEFINKLRQDGIDTLNELTETQLIDLCETASHAYYNTKIAIMTDSEYDIITEFIGRVYPANTDLDQIGAKVTKNKVELPYKMASMDKIKPDTKALTTWTQKYKGQYVLSCKLDGVSGLYTTEGDEPKLYTRGNGTIGQDISHLLPILQLPTEPNVVVRGEFIIPRIVFDEKYKSKFANPRNLVSGIINSKTIDEKTKDVHFVAYETIKPELRPSAQMEKLIELGHKVVQHKTVDQLSNEMLSELLMDWRTNHEYEIDGVIVTDDHIYTRKDGNPDHAFAFKMIISDQIAEAKVVDVVWSPSKSGYLKPRVRIEPIKLGGVTIEYATGFNGKFIKDNRIGIGAIIQIIRSGDVIPYIKSITAPAEVTKMPTEKYHWTDTNVDIVIDNVDVNETVQQKNITDFFKGIEVDGIGMGNVKKIMKAGHTSVPDILQMSKEDFQKVDGFKTKMVNKVHDGINTQISKASLLDIMAASNKFGRGIGKRKIKPIMDVYPDILTRDETIDEKIMMLQTIDGIGKENANSFVNNIPVFLDFMKECNLLDKVENSNQALQNEFQPAETVAMDENNPLYKKHIVMTKVRDAEIIEHLKTVGGILDNTISKQTYTLIVKSLDDVSNKTKKATEEKIPIMTPEMFKAKYIK